MNAETTSAASAVGAEATLSAVNARTVKQIPRRFRNLLALDDFEQLARRRLPRMIFGYVDGAVETGSAMRAAAAALAELSLVPRYLVDVSGREHGCQLFGKRYAAPFGVAPLGGAAMVGYRADQEMAAAAGAVGVPMILSASSLVRLEEIGRDHPTAWFQAYLPGDMQRIDPMIDRVAAAGFETLVITTDTPVPGNRENNIRNGFSMPLRVTPKVALDGALHPRWLLGTMARTLIKHGIPHFENMDAARGPPMMSQNFIRNMNSRDQLSWRHVEAIRKRWGGKLVIKGILCADDAQLARAVGADGVIVSNHGGRQLDHAIAPVRVLPEILACAGEMAVMVDGGIRRGTDVLKALALGAQFVFLGRPFLYAAAIGGRAGVTHAMDLLIDEIQRGMALLGLRSLKELTPGMVRGLR